MILRYHLSTILLTLAGLYLAAGCSKDNSNGTPPADGSKLLAADLLPPAIEAYQVAPEGWQRIVFSDSLGEYVGAQAAAEYQLYNFEGLVAAKYSVQGIPLTVEVVQFASMDDAYGFYSRLRPDGVRLAGVGAESYRDGNSLYFMADLYAVTISAEAGDEKSMQAQSLLAHEITSGVRHTRLPGFFTLYPSRWKVEPSNHYYPSDYLGIPGLNEVYAVNYDLDGDTAVFFMTEDLAGQAYLLLRQYAETIGSVASAPDSIPYVAGYSFMFDHPQKGRIVAGLIRSKLVGVVGFNEQSHLHLTSLWVRGLQ